tara:strand:- start:1934 stop:2830 length:897 start_codon:yes stop_codon:yes gene_type:complete
MPSHNSSMLSLMLGSPITVGVVSGAPGFTATITANEDGVGKLAKLMCSLRGDAAVANTSLALWKIAQVGAITLNGADLYIRGANVPGAPMSQFAPDRRGIIPGLPDVDLRSQDTILISGIYTYAGGVSDYSVGIPFTPGSKRGVAAGAPLIGPEVVSASPDTALANGAPTAVTITFDTNGVFDMSRLVIGASIPPTPNINATSGVDYVNNVTIRQLILRSDYNNVVGAGVPEFTAGVFNGNRAENWLQLGRHRVTSGDQLVATLFQRSGVIARASMSVPMTVAGGGVPSAGDGSKCGC